MATEFRNSGVKNRKVAEMDQPLRGNFQNQASGPSAHIVPTIIEETNRGRVSFDPFSRLLKERIIFFGTGVNDVTANLAVAEMLYFEYNNSEKEITLYINSPGGVIYSGLGIVDTMKYIDAPVATICEGLAASMGSILLAAGEPGKRAATPNARIMIHQPLGGAQGQATDIEIRAKEINFLKDSLYAKFTDWAGLDSENIEDMKLFEEACDRDNFLTPTEARAMGLIDNIIFKSVKSDPNMPKDKSVLNNLRRQEIALKDMLAKPHNELDRNEKAIVNLVNRRIEAGVYDPQAHNQFSSDYGHGSGPSAPPPAANTP